MDELEYFFAETIELGCGHYAIVDWRKVPIAHVERVEEAVSKMLMTDCVYSMATLN